MPICNSGIKESQALRGTKKRGILAKKLNTLDRRVLETLILPGYAERPKNRRVLFVGCADFTKSYESYFSAQVYFTI